MRAVKNDCIRGSSSITGRPKSRATRRASGILLLSISWALALAWTLTLPAPSAAQAPPASTTVRPAGARGTVVVPGRFLRRWDPVTIFFEGDLGPAGGGPEDDPGRFVNVEPDHPGAFTWLDARTLQFRPAEPWPPLARFTWQAGGARERLTTLMAAPAESLPRDGAEGLAAVDRVSLTFPEPLDQAALERMVTIELRPLPGIGEGGGRRFLTREDFEVKAAERTDRADSATYVLALRQAVPLGTRALVKLRLALEDDAEESFTEISFSTAEPFRATSLGCRRSRYPVTPEGSRYSADQALDCGSDSRTVVVELSAPPREIGPVAGRSLVRFEPPVDGLRFEVAGRQLAISGDFGWETPYRVTLVGAEIVDRSGRPLDLRAESEVWVYFPRREPYLRWGASQGVVERFGPQRVPVEGRGQERLDLRLYPVDPLDRSFWPFPDSPVSVDESQRPPGPGEEPEPYRNAYEPIDAGGLAAQLSGLGAPPVSELAELPLRREGGAATFGLDLADPLGFLAGKGAAGSYLVGMRRLDRSTERSWIRVQATDLSLTTAEEPHHVVFAVTSLSTGRPVAGARVRVEGVYWYDEPTWQTFFEGTTDGAGRLRWKAPGNPARGSREVRRIVVESGEDTLVLDAHRAPDGYADNQWSESYYTWLQWTQESLIGRAPEPETLAHVFTERPVYRPEEPVHVKGWVRGRAAGRLQPVLGPAWVVVEGPGDLVWRYGVELSESGGFYHRFAEDKRPTGVYRVRIEGPNQKETWGQVSFRIEAYRIPRFEVQLHAEDRVPLDHEFQVGLTATYYAGGRVAGRPVAWRVTQFPYTWSPKGREGFLYSSDGRFSGTGRFESTPRLERDDVLDENGSAQLTLDPGVEPTAQPRTYVVEATVTGADDQTVTSTKRVLALPPFVLGLKVPRYLERADRIEPEVIALGTDGKEMTGLDVTVRLLHRQWHSHLRASDFSDGVARYVTDVVDEKIAETLVTTDSEPVAVPFDLPAAGVYLVEIEARDRLDRAQVVTVDLYAGGDEPVAWSKPPAGTFEVTADEKDYGPGDTARLVLQSPYQTAEALVIVEAPEGNRYEWLPVRGGKATFELPILPTFVPRLPVHFVLMRGRVPGSRPLPGAATDLGKPATVASTSWVSVRPDAHRVEVDLEHPASARPGQEIEVSIDLHTPEGAPLPGEVTLWLVDQTVLALGQEQRLDPVPDFITPVSSRLEVRDTRSFPFGEIPFAEQPGGDGGEPERKGLLDRATVRKNFQPVPYYQPSIQVGPDGKATVKVELPDNLTNFKLRAKAASGTAPDGWQRFGFGTGHLEVRLPVIVQPALPRFARPGDRFAAAAIGRVVEGEGGPGAAEARVEGAVLEGPARRELEWAPEEPERIEFAVTIPTPAEAAAAGGAPPEAVFRMAVERLSDGAADAFEVRIPILPDRDPVLRRELVELVPGEPFALPGPEEPARAGTLRRSVLVSDQAALVRMAGGLDFLRRYPYGCTEQRISRARAYLALRGMRDVLHQRGLDDELDRAVGDTLQWLPTVVDPNGLCAYWPGSKGSVSLTAWVVEFLGEARDAGYTVDPALFTQLARSLERALRSDYSHFIDGEMWAERAWSLAALAQVGRLDSAYAAELARKSQFLDLEGVAIVAQSFAAGGERDAAAVDALVREMWDGLIVRLYQGREVYGGLQSRRPQRNGLILPSESRTVSEVLRAMADLNGADDRVQLLTDALVTLGRGDGWGSTNANAAALLALSEILKPPFHGAGNHRLNLEVDGRSRSLELGPEAPVAHAETASAGPASLTLAGGSAGRAVMARAEAEYVPEADGGHAAAESHGFVVQRELLRVLSEDEAPERLVLGEPGLSLSFEIGQVVEEHVEVVNPADRNYVAVVIPLGAGFEPLNPNLATAPPEAKARGTLTLEPTYVAFLDDRVAFYYNGFPKGTYHFYYRTRATTAGSFVQPPAKAEMMYDAAVFGQSNGCRLEIAR